MLLYHFVNRQYGLENLRRRRLKIARWNDLNDPFELAGANFADDTLRSKLRQMKDAMHHKVGLLCFSENWKNPVQWSHYGENHKGMCLAFEVANDILQQVNYVNERINCTYSDIERSSEQETYNNLFHILMTTKYADWRYEREWRIFTALKNAEGEMFFQNFDQDVSLREVIVGASSDLSRAEIADALGDQANGVDAYKARLGFKQFEIVKNQDLSLWK